MKSVFITGAGSGMGREGAKLFHAKGWRVGAVDRNEDGLATLQEELGDDRLWTRAVDVTDKAALEGALADFCAGNSGGGLDMMWNNAGIGESGWFEDVPYEAAMRVVEVNFKAVLTGAYAALPYLKKIPGSLMFSTSSSAGTYGMPRIAVYSSTKHAVKGLTEALSVEWHRHGVRVADVLPGLIDTAILTTTTNHSDDRRSGDVRRGAARECAEEGHDAADAGKQRGGGGLAGLPRSEAVALVRAQEHSRDRSAQGPEPGARAGPHRQGPTRADAEAAVKETSWCKTVGSQSFSS